MFEIGMYLFILYCLCFVKNTQTYVLQEQVMGEIDPDLEEGEDIIIYDDKEDHWK